MFQSLRKICFWLVLIIFVSASSCGKSEKSSIIPDVFNSDDTQTAIELIDEANRNLKSIRALYKANESKVDELKKALKGQDIEQVKKLTDDLSLIINDGYVFAESAKEKIVKAQELDINPDWKEYLRLKDESLAMQIKAFDFRKESAELFRDKFGGNDKAQMAEAARIFKKNEENYAEYMGEAAKKNQEADQLAKEVGKK